MAVTGEHRPGPLTQAQRREQTRTALLEATIACLAEYGYGGTTTARVAERAGVSRGAQPHYFASKQALVAAAVEHLAQRRMADLAERVRSAPPGAERNELLVDTLWDMHSGPLFDATLELMVAARTDPELHEQLVALERRVNRTIATVLEEFGGGAADRAVLRDELNLVIAAARGYALLRIADGQTRSTTQRHWRAARERLLGLLAE